MLLKKVSSLYLTLIRVLPPVPLNNREAIQTTILPTGGGRKVDKPILVKKGRNGRFFPIRQLV